MADLLDLTGAASDTNGSPIDGQGSKVVIRVSATSFGGGNVQAQLAEIKPAPIWVTVSDSAGTPLLVTDNRDFVIDVVPNGMLLRAILTGSTGASDVRVVAL